MFLFEVYPGGQSLKDLNRDVIRAALYEENLNGCRLTGNLKSSLSLSLSPHTPLCLSPLDMFSVFRVVGQLGISLSSARSNHLGQMAAE